MKNVLFLFFLLFVSSQTAYAQSTRQVNQIVEGLDYTFPYEQIVDGREPLEALLKAAILKSLVHCKQRLTGENVIIRSCRKASPNGCEDRIEKFVEYIVDAGIKYDINPWLLAAVAYNESRFNPYAVGYAVGSMGIFQINPKSKRGKKAKFIRNKRYRHECKWISGNCQQQIVHMGAEHLRSAIDYCGGLQEGLSIYNTGYCTIRRKYVFNTVKSWRNLLKHAESENNNIPWCSSRKSQKRIDNDKI